MFEQPVYTLAFRMCQNPTEAQDVMQEAFIQVLTKLEQFRGDSPFWGWLRMVTVNTCLGHLRKRKRLPLSLVDDDYQHPTVTDSPGEQKDLDLALAQLTDEARAVVWLYDVEGYTHAEIAELFGKTVSFSKSRLSRAHSQLRQWLGQEPTTSEPADPIQSNHEQVTTACPIQIS